MSNLSVQKVNALPEILQSNTLYLKKSLTSGMLEIYVTNNNATDIRRAVINSDIDDKINGLDLAYFLRDSYGLMTDIVDKDDNLFLSNKLQSLGSCPYPTDVPIGTIVKISTANSLSGLGKTLKPIELVNDGEVWLLNGEQTIYSKLGSYSSPAINLTTVSGDNPFFASGNLLKIPYQLMYLGMGIRIRFIGYKPDADSGATTFKLLFGNSTDALANNVCLQLSTAAAANHQIPFDILLRVSTLGATGVAKFTTPSMAKLFTSGLVVNNSGDFAGEFNTLFSTIENNYISIVTNPTNVGSQSALVNYIVSLVP